MCSPDGIYTSGGIVYKITVHADAESDLERIAEADEYCAAFLVALIQEFEGDQNLLDRLSQNGFCVQAGPDWAENVDVKRWIVQWNAGKNLWRLKSWELEGEGLKYRIVYAYKPQVKTYTVLGIFHRSEFNYESNSILAKRIFRAYAEL